MIGTWLLAASVVIQFLLAGIGVLADPRFLGYHAAVNAAVIFFLPLLLVVAGRLGGIPGRTLWLMAAVSGLVVVQSLLLLPYHMRAPSPFRAISGLHAVNALFVFWVSLQLLERVRSLEPETTT